MLMKTHARTGPVAVAGLEKMLVKVPWLLGEVSLSVCHTVKCVVLVVLWFAFSIGRTHRQPFT